MNLATVRKIVVGVLLVVSIAGAVFGQHWTTPQPTGIDHSLVITAASNDGVSLVAGDEVGVFTPDGILAGHLVWTSETVHGLALWGDDPTTDSVVEGFMQNQAMEFRCWIAGEELEVNADPIFASGPTQFAVDGFSTLSLEAISSATKGELQLLPSNETISAWPQPFNASVTISVPEIFNGNTLIVFDMNGRRVKKLRLEGSKTIWDGTDWRGNSVGSGVYFCRITGRKGPASIRLVKLD